MVTALIFAGGSGIRMNFQSKPKQFLQFYGKELIVYTLDNFQIHKEVDNIIIVCIKEWISYLEQIIKKYHINKVLNIVPGGATGQESIYNGLKYLKEFTDENPIVLVHDGVRPFVNAELITKCINSVKKYGNAITISPAIETVITKKNEQIDSIINRNECFHAKAPQCFYLNDLIITHEKAIIDGNIDVIDSATLMKKYNYDLYTVMGNFDNIKITTPMDFYIFKSLYEARENQQIFGLKG